MPRGWEWDPTLFHGTAPYYRRGRPPYPSGMHDAFAAAADLGGAPRLIDVGCGPGTVALMLADLFVEVVGVDPDPEMLQEARRAAEEQGVTNVRWLQCRAEDLPVDPGAFRYATFAQSFHWMDRERVAGLMFQMLEPGGAFVHVDSAAVNMTAMSLPHPEAPTEEIERLRVAYLGEVRRAGQGVLLHGTPGDEWGVLRKAGFAPPVRVPVPGEPFMERSADDIVAGVFSSSGTAPHLFGERLADFERDLRHVLAAASPDGWFAERARDVALVLYRRPAG